MATTQIPWGSPQAVKVWSPKLILDIQRDGYFSKRFVGKGSNNVIEERTELEKDKGDIVQFDLAADLRGQPTFGDDRLEGKEDQLRFSQDQVSLDQVRYAVSLGGRMSRKRTNHELRETGAQMLRRYWARYLDEHHFITLSGTRGHNADYILPTTYTGFAGNSLLAPDAEHLMYGGSATSKATLTSADKMTRNLVERAATKTKMLKALNPDATNMVPLSVEGADRFVPVMSPLQTHDLRTDTGTGNWFDLQKAIAASDGAKNKICQGGLGLLANVILHEHESVIRFNDYGAGSNVTAARALLMGCQAGMMAYGSTGGNRFIWKEMTKDYDNEPAISGGYIYGEKKTRFGAYDFGVIAIDTYAANPN